MKDKLLIIQKAPFGSLTDSYKWCQYLKEYYDISVLCFDDPEFKEKMEGINIKRISTNGPFLLRGVRFIFISLLNIFHFNGKIFVVYFKHCDVLKKIFPNRKMNLDIRTLAVEGNAASMEKYNSNLKQTCELYNSVSIISEGIIKNLKLNNENVFLLPLGSDCISIKQKDFSKLKLLYVGTFRDRRIDDTIKGVYDFVNNNPTIPISYDIVGRGYPGELEKYKEMVGNLGLSRIITLHGYIHHTKLKLYFDECNIGVSYVPITSYFDHQPVTKSFEYILSGLYTIATSTIENKKIITNENGILIQDTPECFSNALDIIYRNLNDIDEIKVRNSLKSHTWENIVKTYLCPILKSL